MKVQLYTYLTSVPLWRNQLNIWKNMWVVPYENNYLVSPIWEHWLNMINTLINAARTNQTSWIKPFAKTVKESFKPFTIFTKHFISAIELILVLSSYSTDPHGKVNQLTNIRRMLPRKNVFTQFFCHTQRSSLTRLGSFIPDLLLLQGWCSVSLFGPVIFSEDNGPTDFDNFSPLGHFRSSTDSLFFQTSPIHVLFMETLHCSLKHQGCAIGNLETKGLEYPEEILLWFEILDFWLFNWSILWID